MFNLEIEDKKATVESKYASARDATANAESQEIENEIVKASYPNIISDKNEDSRAKQIDNAQKEIETVKLLQEPTESVNINV